MTFKFEKHFPRSQRLRTKLEVMLREVMVSKLVYLHFKEESPETHQSVTLACQNLFSGHPDPQTPELTPILPVSKQSGLLPAPLPF